MNVVLWARVSSREQREGYSIDAQLRAMHDRVVRSDWKVVREFVVAESAKRGAERAAFNAMFKWVRANAKKEKIEAILSHKLDRACRNMRDAVRLQELEDDCGVHLAFIENQFGPGAAGAFSFNVMAAVAQYYSDNLRTEVLKGMDEKVRQGWPTGHAPFGYVNVDDPEEPVKLHPEKSLTLVRLFDLYATGRFTFKGLAQKLHAEGHSFRQSQPRFHRTGLSHILNNRFYVGELVRHGKVYPGKYSLVIDRRTFERCQEVLNGKNRRTGNPDILFSGGILRCGICGCAITGEEIRRKLLNGDHNKHIYYRCGNNIRPEGHPKVRWREEDVEMAILREFEALRLPSPEIAAWFRETLAAAFDDASRSRAQMMRMLSKRKSELAGMKDRLLNIYLTGGIEEAIYQAKAAEIARDAEDTERQIAETEAQDYDAKRRETALAVFDFSQNLAEIWRGSNSTDRREILECISLNRVLTDVSLVLTKTKPFDALAEQAVFNDGRGERI